MKDFLLLLTTIFVFALWFIPILIIYLFPELIYTSIWILYFLIGMLTFLYGAILDEKLKIELNKCILLCSNCHREEHNCNSD